MLVSHTDIHYTQPVLNLVQSKNTRVFVYYANALLQVGVQRWEDVVM